MPSSYEGSYAIPEGITTIGTYAFQGCSGLTSVTIPSSVTSIGRFAFSDCTGLTSVTIPSSVTSIGYRAFEGCSGLTEPIYSSNIFVYMPSSYEGSYAIPEGITTIGADAFQGCSSLTSVTIPEGVTSIGDDAFFECRGLTSVVIPSSVTSIGSLAFEGCSGLTSVKVNWNRPLTNNLKDPFGLDNSVYNNATLYVPKGTAMMYMAADEWSDFVNILEFEDGEDVHYITIRMGDGGVLKQSVDVGKIYTYTVCADEGWEVNTLTFDGKDMTSLLMDDQFSTPVITGNSELNVVFKQNETGLKKVMSHSNVKVYASNKNITVTGADMNAKVDVYSINGAFVTSAIGNTTIPLEHGVYIVKVGQESFKVRL